jgi:hypothetical protein
MEDTTTEVTRDSQGRLIRRRWSEALQTYVGRPQVWSEALQTWVGR